MASSIARKPWQLGVLLGLLIAAMATMLIMQTIYAGSSGPDAGGTIAEQGGAIVTDAATEDAPQGGNAAGATAGDTGSGWQSPLLEEFGEGGANNLAPIESGGVGNAIPGHDGPGSISGIIRAAGYAAGGPAPRLTVFLADGNGNFTGATVLSGTDGRFAFPDLTPGLYRIYFFDVNGIWQAAWYGEATTAGGSSVRVAAGSVTEISQEIQPAEPATGAIAGRVADTAGAGISGVSVLAYSVGGDGSLVLRGEAETDAEGAYSIVGLQPTASEGTAAGLPAGYKVLFLPSGNLFASQWFENQPTHLTAKLIAMKPGETVGGIDARLTGGGTISGRVTVEGGQPAVYALVDIYDESGVIIDSQVAAGDGSYVSDTLPAGTYRLRVTPRSGLYVAEWYNDKYDFASADTIYVLSGKESSGINVSLGVEGALLTGGDTVIGESLEVKPLVPPAGKKEPAPVPGSSPAPADAVVETTVAGPPAAEPSQASGEIQDPSQPPASTGAE